MLKLDKTVCVNRIEVDTTHFKGNCPDNVKIEGTLADSDRELDRTTWLTVLNRTKVCSNT